jgi:polyhydroxybutyrate depolymerase
VGVSRITVTGGGAEHAVRVFVPSSFDGTPLAAVLGWHGLGSNGDEQAALSGYEELADEQGFVVVHPTGVADPGSGITSWQLADDPAGGRDDVSFAEALIDELVARWCVDPTRIYATGMSNGGYFTTRLLCELGDRIAAGVAVAGLYHPDGCAPTRPVPLLAFHGTDDRVVPYGGGDSVLFGEGVPPDLSAQFEQSIRSEYEQFVAGNGCTTAATDTFLDSEIVIHTYEGCDGGFVMALFEVRFGGHTWPGSPLRDVLDDSLGFTTGRVEATRDGWVYMRGFSLP